MFASWSRTVTTISSPGPRPRASDRDSCIVRVVMLGPKTTSDGWDPSRSAAARRAEPITSSVSRLVANAPPELALLRAR
jgi:hypothetical protein